MLGIKNTPVFCFLLLLCFCFFFLPQMYDMVCGHFKEEKIKGIPYHLHIYTLQCLDTCIYHFIQA